MKITFILLLGLYCTCFFGCQVNYDQNINNQCSQHTAIFYSETEPPLPVPSIIADIDIDPNLFSHLKFEWYYSGEGAICWQGKNVPSTNWVQAPFKHIPKPTTDYTKYLIYKFFLPEPWKYADSLDHITSENFNETAIGTLQFEPLRLNGEDRVFNEIWNCRVGVIPLCKDIYGKKDSFGKGSTIKRLLVSQNGHILYQTYNNSRGWAVSCCNRTSEGLIITIIDNVQENPEVEELPATATQYLYHHEAPSFEKLKSENINIPKIIYYGSDSYH